MRFAKALKEKAPIGALVEDNGVESRNSASGAYCFVDPRKIKKCNHFYFSGPMTSCTVKPCLRMNSFCFLTDLRFFNFLSKLIASALVSNLSDASNCQGIPDWVDLLAPLLCLISLASISEVCPM